MLKNSEFPTITYCPESGRFFRIKTGEATGTANTHGYIQIYANGRRWSAGRLAWLFHFGYWPSQTIDHINRQRGDNRIVNLRDISYAENNKNRAVHTLTSALGVSGFKGVYRTDRGDYIAKRWDAKKKRQIYLGRFSSACEADAVVRSTAHR